MKRQSEAAKPAKMIHQPQHCEAVHEKTKSNSAFPFSPQQRLNFQAGERKKKVLLKSEIK